MTLLIGVLIGWVGRMFWAGFWEGVHADYQERINQAGGHDETEEESKA